MGKERGDIHETGEIKRVVSTLLLQMDQLPAHVVIVTATNHAELLDRAVWRRFQLRLNLPPPGPKELHRFLSGLIAGLHLRGKFDLAGLAPHLRGASYSEIEELFLDISRRAVLEAPEPNIPRIVRQRMAAWTTSHTDQASELTVATVCQTSQFLSFLLRPPQPERPWPHTPRPSLAGS